MWSAEVARQLRERGHDVIAVVERSDLRGLPDATIFELADAEGRAIVTENARDFHQLAMSAIRSSTAYPGVVYTSNQRFPRGDSRTIGRVSQALEQLLTEGIDLSNREWWLSEPTP